MPSRQRNFIAIGTRHRQALEHRRIVQGLERRLAETQGRVGSHSERGSASFTSLGAAESSERGGRHVLRDRCE